MTRKRKLATLSRADIGKRIAFVSSSGKNVEGVVRSFVHGVFSNMSKGEVDVPLVNVSVYATRSHESHWATPNTLAVIKENES